MTNIKLVQHAKSQPVTHIPKFKVNISKNGWENCVRQTIFNKGQLTWN